MRAEQLAADSGIADVAADRCRKWVLRCTSKSTFSVSAPCNQLVPQSAVSLAAHRDCIAGCLEGKILRQLGYRSELVLQCNALIKGVTAVQVIQSRLSLDL